MSGPFSAYGRRLDELEADAAKLGCCLRVEDPEETPTGLWAVWCGDQQGDDEDIIGAGETRQDALDEAAAQLAIYLENEKGNSK